MNKRRKEIERREWQQKKIARRADRAKEAKERPAAEGDEDPDLAGIIPGPQPPLEE